MPRRLLPTDKGILTLPLRLHVLHVPFLRLHHVLPYITTCIFVTLITRNLLSDQREWNLHWHPSTPWGATTAKIRHTVEKVAEILPKGASERQLGAASNNPCPYNFQIQLFLNAISLTGYYKSRTKLGMDSELDQQYIVTPTFIDICLPH